MIAFAILRPHARHQSHLHCLEVRFRFVLIYFHTVIHSYLVIEIIDIRLFSCGHILSVFALLMVQMLKYYLCNRQGHLVTHP